MTGSVDLRRVYQSPVHTLTALIALAFAGLGMVQPVFFVVDRIAHYALIFWLFSAVIYWLNELDEAESLTLNWFGSITFFLISLVCGGYFLTNLGRLDLALFTDRDMLVASGIIVSTMIGTYKEYGAVLFIFGLLTILYGYFGPHLPGFLNHAGLGNRVITATTLEFNGVFGVATRAGARWILIFLIFAGVIKAYGGLQVFMQLGLNVARYISSGIVQTAVISSLIIGSITGSPIANTAFTGSFTIPLMKERGISSKTAAAIESVASTGGQIMPPVMGITAFVMADLLQLSYTDIIIMAAVPGFLFYLTVIFAVHIIYQKEIGEDDQGTVNEIAEDLDIDIMDFNTVMILAAPILISMAFLVGVLVLERWDPARAAFWTIILLFIAKVGITSVGLRITRKSIDLPENVTRGVLNDVKGFLEGMYRGAVMMAPIGIVLAHLGIIITLMQVTGLGNRTALRLVGLADISIVLFLLLLSGTIILLGMGIPTIAAYLLTITIAAPALTEVGVPEVSAHFFVLYFAILSNITPPIAMACVVAAEIAESDFTATAIESLKIGAPLFVLPYIIIIEPDILQFNFPESLVTITISFVSLLVLMIALANWNFLKTKPLTIVQRIATFGLASGLFFLIIQF